jgi:integrase/recombinase XerD
MLYLCCTYICKDMTSKLLIKPILRLNKITKEGKIPIYFRITQNRKTSYIASGIACTRNEWNEFDNRLWQKKPIPLDLKERGISPIYFGGEEELKIYCKNIFIHPLAKRYNEEITIKLNEYEGQKIKATFLSKKVTSKSFKELLVGGDGHTSEQSFIAYWNKRIDEFDNAEAISSGDTYRDVLKFFERFTKGRNVNFSDITADFVEELTSFLKRQRKKNGESLSQDYIYKIFKTVRALYNHAVDKGAIQENSFPFRMQKVTPNGPSHKERLKENELNKLIDLKLDNGSPIWHARNAFVFAVLSGGTRISDVLLMRWKNIDANNRITYSMKKTKDQSSLPLNDLSIKILSLYKMPHSKSTDFVFPFLSGLENERDAKTMQSKIESKTTTINSNLKLIATSAKINKNLTTHIARHTYAALTIQHNANPMITKKILRHKKFETTQGYIGELNSDLVDNMHITTLSNLQTEII